MEGNIAVTVDGIECSVSNAAFNDIRTLKAFARMRTGDSVALVEFADRFFGREQFDTICESLPNHSIAYTIGFVGRVLEAAAEQVGDDTKN